MRTHHAKTHGESIGCVADAREADVPCPSCERMFVSANAVKQHHVQSHGESLTRVEAQCDVCGETEELNQWRLEMVENWTCSGECHSQLKSEQMTGREIEWADEVSESLKQYYEEHDGPMKRQTHSKETREKLRQINEGREITWGDKISESVKEAYERGDYADRSPPVPQTIEVKETGHEVRSGWEVEVDLMLHELGIDYEYEPQSFSLPCGDYWPDFIVGDKVIEVKGWAREKCITKAKQFCEEYSEYEYIVIQGNGPRMPSDKHISCSSIEELTNSRETFKSVLR